MATRRHTADPASLATAGADGRSRQARGDARRSQILAEAIRYFAERGYRAGGVTGLAERLGMTHPGMLYYFGTKERLLFETVVERVRAERAAFPAIMQTATLDTIVDVVRFELFTAELVRLYVVLGAESLDSADPLHSFFVNRYQHMRDIAANVIRRGQADGTYRNDVDPDSVGAEITAIILGFETQWLMEPGVIDPVAAVEQYVEALRARLRPPRKRTNASDKNRSST